MGSIEHQAHAKLSISTHPFSKVNSRRVSWRKNNQPRTIKFSLRTLEDKGWEQQRERLGGLEITAVDNFLENSCG